MARPSRANSRLSSASCSQPTLGSLGDCEQPELIVKHVHANQASPKRRFLSRWYNEPPEPLQLCGVIAIHSPEAGLYFISRDTMWMAEAACSVQTYSKMHIAKWAPLLFSCVSCPQTSTRRSSNYVGRERSIVFTPWIKTPSVHIQRKEDQGDRERVSQAKFTGTSRHFSKVAPTVAELVSPSNPSQINGRRAGNLGGCRRLFGNIRWRCEQLQ